MAIIETTLTGNITQFTYDKYADEWDSWKNYPGKASYGDSHRFLFHIVLAPGTKTQVTVRSDAFKGGYSGYVYLLDTFVSDPRDVPSSAIASILRPSVSPDGEVTFTGFSTDSNDLYISYYSYVRELNSFTAIATVDDTPPSITLISPKDTTVTFGEPVTFSWSYETPTGFPVFSAYIYYSYDNSIWYSLSALAASATSYTSNTLFISETVYWKIRARTNYSEYSEAIESFSVDINAPSVTLTSPASGASIRGSNAFSFAWSIANGSGNVTGTQLEYSTDSGSTWTSLVDYAGKTTSKPVSAGTFPAGVVLWRVRARDQYAGWSEWVSDSFTITEALPIVSGLSPSGVYRDRTGAIVFSWVEAISFGTITGAELQYDLDDGQGWQTLGTVSGTTAQYTAAADTFPAQSAIAWRVRAKNGGNEYGSWSSASFATIDAPITATPTSPITGAMRDETAAILFEWRTFNSLGSSPTGADLQWRLSSGDWQTLGHVDGSSKQFTAPANTFPGGYIYWRVRAYNQDGVAGSWSGDYAAYFNTIDTPSVSTPISPSGTIEDTDSDLLFRWSTSSTSGSTPTGADLQYSYDGITWLVLGHTDGTTQLTVSSGRIHAGTVQWQVRSYNRNGTPGAWSASATFIAHAAPRILDLITDDKPFTTFTWQATDQRDYHIVIDDDLVIGPVFDEVKTYQLTDYLEDGLHTVKIRVQNEMSVWSEWAETQFQVLNIPDGDIELQGSWDIDADLFWEDQAADAEYMVYRDGGLIGKTRSKAFADRVVLGEHRYHVIRRLSDGCYSISNTVSGSMSTRLTRVAPLVGGEWLALVKSENAKRSERFTRRRKVAYHHFSGNKFPTPEIGDQEELIGEYDAAWMHTEEGAEILDSLVGQAIIVKSRSGKVIIGVLEGYTSGDKKHFSGFTFDLKQMDWEDYVCDI